jgi:FKBP-type peptidyl-prolyl cis-trans isomerase
MLSKFEMYGIGLSVLSMALALYLVRIDTTLLTTNDNRSQTAQLTESGIIFVGEGDDVNTERANALVSATDDNGNLEQLVIDDIMIGTGDPVQEGDIVLVHYIGTLPNGQEFDNSKKRGETFSFKVGQGRVIKGWEDGLVGMKVGGQRILVIPPELAYGKKDVGPIPANSTLVFAIELIEIK